MDESITRLLKQSSIGDENALNRLTPMVYDELKKIAKRLFQRENIGHTLQPTAIINEAFMKLVDVEVDWKSRQHFYAVSANIMRRMLVDYAKQKRADKRGGGQVMATLVTSNIAAGDNQGDLLLINEALEAFAKFDPEKAQIVEWNYFGGLTLDEIAQLKGASKATIHRQLRFAEAWLRKYLMN